MKCLIEDKYMYKYRLVASFEIVKDIVWAHPNSIRLLNTFLTMVQMDSNYKTNKYRQ